MQNLVLAAGASCVLGLFLGFCYLFVSSAKRMWFSVAIGFLILFGSIGVALLFPNGESFGFVYGVVLFAALALYVPFLLGFFGVRLLLASHEKERLVSRRTR